MLTNECWFFVGHITGRHDTHRTLSACPLYHNMSVEDCKVIENCTGVMNSVYSSYLKRQEWCTWLCRSAHRTTHLLHLPLSVTNLSALFHDVSRHRKSSLTVSMIFCFLFPHQGGSFLTACSSFGWRYYACPCEPHAPSVLIFSFLCREHSQKEMIKMDRNCFLCVCHNWVLRLVRSDAEIVTL